MISHHLHKLAKRSGLYLEDTPGNANVRGLLGDLHGSQRELFFDWSRKPSLAGLFRS